MNQLHPSIEQMVDYLHGELPAVEDAAIHAHLSSCSECERRRSEEASITEALRAHAGEGEREVPPRVVASIRQAVTRPARSPAWPSWLLLPVAAAAAVALYIGLSGRHAPVVAKTIDPAYYVNEHAVLSAKEPFSDGVSPVMLTLDNEAR